MRLPLFLVKIFNYEYWSWWVFYLPMAPYWLFQAIRAKSLTYFTAVNPSIEAGGFYGEHKSEILKYIPAEYLPTTLYISPDTAFSEISHTVAAHQLKYPVIAKPNVGERGTSVVKIMSEAHLKAYHASINADYLIQEFIEYPIELGVLFSRMPEEKSGRVSSVTLKEFLTVTGDGKSSIETLVLNNTRARFQLEALRDRLGKGIEEILPAGEKRLLEPIGNHCRGTKFVNANHLINEQLHQVFTTIADRFEGFYYGRFDMKVASYEDLYAGKNIRIMELNGVSSDPGHIYDPRYYLWEAYRDLGWHWNRVAEISIANQKKGIKPVPVRELLKIVKQHFG
ncbi:hypothetical protein [Emticicia agri]|uniref:ATP-grasp domain-containing protein n=1 Tax=Emticicia agri TaxID=2492393 RepID=A0A4Q5LQV4_9BACT|nr:hypothetical protein [Emticicia agri]RYU91835.1 hypothetical protein EWM59_26545 [Emticicia agri]